MLAGGTRAELDDRGHDRRRRHREADAARRRGVRDRLHAQRHPAGELEPRRHLRRGARARPTGTEVRLPARIALRGTLTRRRRRAAGRRLGHGASRRCGSRGASMPADRRFLDRDPGGHRPSTPVSGDFVVWVDPTVADAWGHYDLVVRAAERRRRRRPGRSPTSRFRGRPARLLDLGPVTDARRGLHPRPDHRSRRQPRRRRRAAGVLARRRRSLCTQVATRPRRLPDPRSARRPWRRPMRQAMVRLTLPRP